MSFRTVVIKSRAKIETRLNWLIIRGEEEKWIFLDEIDTLIVESTACAITTQALCELAKNNTNVIFCDEKHLPYGNLELLYSNHQSSGKVKKQAVWDINQKAKVWREIVIQKISWQRRVLEKYEKTQAAHLLNEYEKQVEMGDLSNREGHAAKVYFNALFGVNFTRRTETEINSALNYGYSIILSTFAREIAAAGYIAQLGIHHVNEFNKLNLACDLMESFRPLVDMYVLSIIDFENFKSKLSSILTAKVIMYGKEQFLDNAIRIYTRSALRCIENEDSMPIVEKFILSKDNEL